MTFRPPFFLLLLAALIWPPLAQAGTILKPVRVTQGIWALVGQTGPRTRQNFALNATFGVIVAKDGVILVDSGASAASAKVIDLAVRVATGKPVKWVINTGAQDHRWLGNGYFAAQGAKIIALKRTVKSQKAFAAGHMKRLKAVLKKRLAGTKPVYAAPALDTDHARLELGGVKLEISWPGPAHVPSNAIVWLPDERTVFAGDLVFMDRMLGVLDQISDTAKWSKAFERMAALKPVHVIPGHGAPGPLAKARRDTGDYLAWLVRTLTPLVADMTPLEDVLAKYRQTPAPFRHLQHHETWHPTNVARTYVQLENAGLE